MATHGTREKNGVKEKWRLYIEWQKERVPLRTPFAVCDWSTDGKAYGHFVRPRGRGLFVLGDDAGDEVGGETAVDLVADHSDGGQTAGTDATEGVQ